MWVSCAGGIRSDSNLPRASDVIDVSLAVAFGVLALLGAAAFAVMAMKLGSVSVGRRDAPSGNATVIKGYWACSLVLLIAGIIFLL